MASVSNSDVDKILQSIWDSTTNKLVSQSTPGTARLSQAILSPLIKHVTEQYDLDKLKEVLHSSKKDGSLKDPSMLNLLNNETDSVHHLVFKTEARIASTSELLWGYHSKLGNREDPIQVSIQGLEREKKIGDPLAFTVGLYYQRKSGEPLSDANLVQTLHSAYNKTAVRILDLRAIPLFGEKHIVPSDKWVDGTYVGGLKEPSLVASQISGWMFTRPTSNEARALFRVVKKFFDTNITEKVKKHFTPKGKSESYDIQILRNIAEQIIASRKEMWGITNPEEELDRWLREVDASLVEAKLGSLDAVKSALNLSPGDKTEIEKMSKSSLEVIDDFYNSAKDADNIRMAIRSAKILLTQLVQLDTENESAKKETEESRKNEKKTSQENRTLQRKLKGGFTVESKLPEIVKVPTVEAFTLIGSLAGKKLSSDGNHLMSKRRHPQILKDAFSKETVAHFDSILLSKERKRGKERLESIKIRKPMEETPLNQWLL